MGFTSPVDVPVERVTLVEGLVQDRVALSRFLSKHSDEPEFLNEMGKAFARRYMDTQNKQADSCNHGL